ncbi:branched-chain amino acid ABC transporter permease [Nonomuraea aurantiaca]|jgi:branched-chain amino acid transport system permease protein|uniref:branched-chain amino acid ABC transporter permease n=1 Tax=Nonomuraea aurantiaca TaxID=2878562 RepID=UPI001CD99BB7|nr:branched-chain amino acid ABC transporter permease [Nonomuraea aurantiaca]MCA2226405.1 branched-chain amino acid ABC transporter permease [Nonomuraea aurantiaca]
MTRLLELLVNGVSLGLLYALITLGFVIVFKATRVVNFAHASFLLLGVYVVASAQPSIGFGAAALLGLAVAGLLGLATERLLLSRVDRRNHHAMAILTIGLNVVLTAELTRRLGESVLPLGAPWDGHVVKLGPLTLPLTVVLTIVAVPVLIGGLTALLTLTGWGLAMRASIADAEGAALVGIRLRRVSATAWVLAGLLATAAGIGLASFPSPGVSLSIESVAIAAFPAAIIGGFDSLGGAIAGGLIVGVVQVLVAGNQDSLSFLGLGAGDVVAYLVMIVVLLWRPSGLFGSKEFSRV